MSFDKPSSPSIAINPHLSNDNLNDEDFESANDDNEIGNNNNNNDDIIIDEDELDDDNPSAGEDIGTPDFNNIIDDYNGGNITSDIDSNSNEADFVNSINLDVANEANEEEIEEKKQTFYNENMMVDNKQPEQQDSPFDPILEDSLQSQSQYNESHILLADQITSLTSQILALSNSNNQLSNNNAHLQSQLNELQSAYNDVLNDLDQQEHNNESSNEIHILKSQLSALQSQFNKYQSTSSKSLQTVKSNTQLQSDILRSNLTQLQSEYDALKASNASLQTSNSNLSNLLTTKDDRIALLETTLVKHQSQYSNLCQILSNQNTEFTETLASKDQEIAQLKTQLALQVPTDAVQSELHHVQSLLSQRVSNSNLSQLQQGQQLVNQMHSELEATSDKLTQLKYEIASKNAALHKLELDQSKLQSDYHVLEQCNHDLNTQVAHLLHKKVTIQDTTLNQLELVTFSTISELTTNNHNLQMMLYSLNEKLAMTKQDKKDPKIEAMVSLIKQLKSKLEFTKTELNQLKQQQKPPVTIPTMPIVPRVPADHTKCQLDTQQLQKSLSTANQQISKLQSVITTNKNHVVQLQLQYNQLEQENTELMNNNTKLQQNEFQVKQLQLQVELCNNEVQRLKELKIRPQIPQIPLNTTNTSITAITKERDILQTKLINQQAQQSKLIQLRDSKISKLNLQLQNATSKLGALEMDLKHLHQLNIKLEATNKSHGYLIQYDKTDKPLVDKYKIQLELQLDEILGLKGQVDVLQAQVISGQHTFDKELYKLNKDKEMLTNEVTQLTKQVELHQNSSHASSTALHKKQLQMNAFQQELAQLQALQIEKEQKNSQVQSQLNNQINQLHTQLDAVKLDYSKMEVAVATHLRTINDLQKESREKQLQITTVLVQIQEIKHKYTQVQMRLNEQGEELDGYKEMVENGNQGQLVGTLVGKLNKIEMQIGPETVQNRQIGILQEANEKLRKEKNTLVKQLMAQEMDIERDIVKIDVEVVVEEPVEEVEDLMEEIEALEEEIEMNEMTAEEPIIEELEEISVKTPNVDEKPLEELVETPPVEEINEDLLETIKEASPVVQSPKVATPTVDKLIESPKVKAPIKDKPIAPQEALKDIPIKSPAATKPVDTAVEEPKQKKSSLDLLEKLNKLKKKEPVEEPKEPKELKEPKEEKKLPEPLKEPKKRIASDKDMKSNTSGNSSNKRFKPTPIKFEVEKEKEVKPDKKIYEAGRRAASRGGRGRERGLPRVNK